SVRCFASGKTPAERAARRFRCVRNVSVPAAFQCSKNSAAELLAGNLDTRAHRGSHDNALDILALRRGGLRLDDGFHDRLQVLFELLSAEGSLADGHMDDVGLVETVLDLTGLRLGNGTTDVGGNRTGLGVR